MSSIPIFIGYDRRERAATNVLIDSLYQHCSVPLSITPLVTDQLRNLKIYWRTKDPKQSTDFSFTRFLVPYLMNFKGWGIFMDCDMLCKTDINDLWKLRDNRYSLMCVKHKHIPQETKKFQGEIQSSYPKKNWSSLIMFNSAKCGALNVNYVNEASGLDLHRFNWLENENLVGELNSNWNHLVGVQKYQEQLTKKVNMLHWTLGGPWFKDQRLMGGSFAAEWFSARDEAMKLYD